MRGGGGEPQGRLAGLGGALEFGENLFHGEDLDAVANLEVLEVVEADEPPE